MDLIPGRNEALIRAYLMRSLRDEGASIDTIAQYFGYQASNVLTIIAWHERIYPVMPDADETGAPNLLNHFRLKRPP